MAYQATPWLSFGTPHHLPVGPAVRPSVPQRRHQRLRGVSRRERGITPGANINDPADDRQLRLPDQMEVNVQTRVNFMPLIGKQLDFYVDVLNALALRTVTGVSNQDGPDVRHVDRGRWIRSGSGWG